MNKFMGIFIFIMVIQILFYLTSVSRACITVGIALLVTFAFESYLKKGDEK